MRPAGPWISLLATPSGVAAQSAGLDPVGDVMGAIATRVGRRGSGPLDPRTGKPLPGTTTSGDARGSLGYRPYARAVDHAYTEALRRLEAEATDRQADGVVGVTFQVDEDAEGLLEIVVRGTAVRARTTRRPAGVFTTELDGARVGALLRDGWVPVAAVWGFSIGVRPTDWTAAQQRRWTAGTVEVTGYTDLVTRVRADAREQLTARARRAGADGVLTSTMTLHEPSDLVCQALVRGTAIARTAPDRAAQQPGVLTVMPLRDAGS